MGQLGYALLITSLSLPLLASCKDKNDETAASTAAVTTASAADNAAPEASAEQEEEPPELPPDTSAGGGVPVAEDYEKQAAEAVPVDQPEAEVDRLEAEITSDSD